jgi:hypothetical protein
MGKILSQDEIDALFRGLCLEAGCRQRKNQWIQCVHLDPHLFAVRV